MGYRIIVFDHQFIRMDYVSELLHHLLVEMYNLLIAICAAKALLFE